MAKTLQHRRDTTTNLGSEAGAIGEFFMDTTKNTLVVMDGSTTGGHPLATESYVDTSINNLIGGAPGTLDTLNELAAALNDDANVYTTLTNSIATKQDTLVSGTTIKTVNGTSLLGSGNITISGGSSTTYSLEAQLLAGGARLTLVGSDASTDEIQFRSGTGTSVTRTDASTITISAAYNDIGSDVLPNIDGIYDLGSDTTQWYDLFVSNGVTIGGSSLTGNSTGLVTDTMLIGDLLLTTNTITPDASTALQYNGDQGVVDIIGNLDVSAGDWLLPAIVDNFSETTTVKANAAGLTGESFWISGNSVARSFYFESQAARTAFIDNFLKAGAEITFNFSYPGGDWIANIASDFDADSDLSTTETGSPDPLQPYGVIVGNSKWSWDTVAGEGEPTNGLYTMTYTTSATYTTSSGVPLTTGTEGAIRYNKIESALQLYTDSWNNVVPLNTDNANVYDDRYDTNGYGAYQLPSTLTLESGKRYMLSSHNTTVTAYLPDNPTIGDSIEILWSSMSQLTITNPASGWNSLVISGNNSYLYTFVYVGLKDNAPDALTWTWWHTGGSVGSITKT